MSLTDIAVVVGQKVTTDEVFPDGLESNGWGFFGVLTSLENQLTWTTEF